MDITPKNFPRHEIIGLESEVVDSSDESQIGIRGEVLDETESLLRIECKKVEKKNCVFLFTLPDGKKVELDGKIIEEKPEERVEMKLPDKWEYID